MRDLFKYSVLSFLLLATISIDTKLVWADVTATEERADQGTRIVYRLTVDPAAEPTPAMRYRLTTQPHETIPGNAITHYLRSFGENSLDTPLKVAQDKFGLEFYEWGSVDNLPIHELPMEKLQEVSALFDTYVNEHIRRATQCRFVDWGLAEEDLRGPEAIEFLLPSVQQTRSIARVLCIRTRLAIAEGRFDDAVEHLKMTYTLGQNAAKMDFLVSGLVGIAEVGMAHNNMIDLIGAPGSPNMYWAMQEMPRPVISLRDSMRLEMTMGLRLIPALMDAESAEHSDEEWTRIFQTSIRQLSRMSNYISNGISNQNANQLQADGFSALIGLGGYRQAKNRLIEQGMDVKVVDQMAVGQVMMIDALRDYRRIADTYETALYLPFKQAEKRTQNVENEMRSLPGKLRFGVLIADQLLPAVLAVRSAQARVESQRNVLLAIEAIRMHAAETGKLPMSLQEVTVVPVPNNVATGKPFSYQCDGKTAVLDLPFGELAGFARRYEIQLRDQ